MEKRYLSLRETSEYCGLELCYVYRLSCQNRLPGKITWGARTIRVDRVELDRWLAGMIDGQ